MRPRSRDIGALKWYDGGHELNDVRALADRAAFLRERLGLRPVSLLLRRAFDGT